jgi:hypothetical protein
MPDPTKMVALNVTDSAEDGPDVAVVAVTTETVRAWIGEIDQVQLAAQAAAADGMYGVMRWDHTVYWLKGGELAEELADVVDLEWKQLTTEQAEMVADADRDHDARADAVRRFTTTDAIQWRAYPHYGPGDWSTAKLSRDDLVELLGELSDPPVFIPPTTLALPEGQLRVYEPDPAAGDLGRMYVLDVLGISLLIRQRADGVYVHADSDATSAAVSSTLLVEVNNSGESEHSL